MELSPEKIPNPGAKMMSCGLLTSSKEPVPLHRSSVSVLIRGLVADVGCQLLHRNEELGPVEAVFKFPVDAEAVVDTFQAWLRGACIQAHLQEKRQVLEGSLMGDPAVMMTLLPRVPEVVPAQSQPGSSSSCWAAPAARPAPWTAETCPASASTAPRDGQAGGCARWARGAVPGEQPRLAGPVGLTLHPYVCPQETLVLLLKSFPLGCYFNIYGFGSEFESFYPQSVENTQQTKAESLQRLQLLQANLGGTEILEPLRAIYRIPCRDGHPRQLLCLRTGR
ncbi:unnamed protein product [Eretmochelys imbricata]